MGTAIISNDHTTGNSTSCTYTGLTTINNNYNYNNTTTSTDAFCYEDEFNELVGLYPKSSKWNNGRTVPLSKNLPECKKLYIKILNTGNISHQEIKACLKAELAERERTGTQQYQPSLLIWLNESGWENYKELALQPVYEPYGTQIVWIFDFYKIIVFL